MSCLGQDHLIFVEIWRCGIYFRNSPIRIKKLENGMLLRKFQIWLLSNVWMDTFKKVRHYETLRAVENKKITFDAFVSKFFHKIFKSVMFLNKSRFFLDFAKFDVKKVKFNQFFYHSSGVETRILLIIIASALLKYSLTRTKNLVK